MPGSALTMSPFAAFCRFDSTLPLSIAASSLRVRPTLNVRSATPQTQSVSRAIIDRVTAGGLVAPLPRGPRSFRRPDERLRLELAIAHVQRGAVHEEQARRLGPSLHRRDVQRRLADGLVAAIGIEAARQHRLERSGVVAL